MAEFVNDTFTDVNATRLEQHTPDLGGVWDQILVQPWSTGSNFDSAFISTNRVSGTPRGGRAPSLPSSLYRNAATPANSEYDVKIDITLDTKLSNAYYSLAGRMDPTGTNNSVDRYVTTYRDAVGLEQFDLRKVVSGVETVLDTLVEDIGVGTFAFKLEIRDATKRVFLGAVQKLTHADNAITQVGRAGLGAPNPSASLVNYMDNYVAETAVAGPVIHTGNLALSGAGAMASTPLVIMMGTLALAGAGVITPTGHAIVLGTAPLAGAGALQGTGHAIVLAEVALTGAGVITFTGHGLVLASMALSGAGSLIATGRVIMFATLPLTGAGDIAFVDTDISVKEGTLNLTGAGSLAAVGELTAFVSLPLSGAGSLAAIGEEIIMGSLPLSGAGNLQPTGALIIFANVALSGAGVMLGTGHAIVLGVAPLAGAGDIAFVDVAPDEWEDFGEIIRLIDAVASETYDLQVVAKSIDGVTPAEIRLWNITDGMEEKRTSTTSSSPALVTTLTPVVLSGSKRYKVQVRNT